MNRRALDYAPPRTWRRRTIARCVIAVLTAIMLGAIARRWAPPIWEQARYLDWQRQVARFAPPVGQPALETDPSNASNLLKNSPNYAPVPARWVEPCKRRRLFAALFPQPLKELRLSGPPFGNSPPDGIAFLHERRSPDGERYLVVVPYWVYGDGTGDVVDLGHGTVYRRASWRPGARLSPLHRSEFWVSVSPAHTIHFGVPDPADESHFVIDLEYPYNVLQPPDHFIIDGWVRDGGLLEMRPRPGRITDLLRGAQADRSGW